jgi:hypothetical protein
VHEAGLEGIAVVVADQVEHPVDDQQVQLGRERNANAMGLAPGCLGRDHDLANERDRDPRRLERERQHIGAPDDAPVAAVETRDGRVVHHQHVDGAGRPAQRPEGTFGGPGEPPRRDGDLALAIGDRRWHHEAAGGEPRSALRASWAS